MTLNRDLNDRWNQACDPGLGTGRSMQRLQHGQALGWVWSQPGGRAGSEVSLQLFMGAAFPTSHSFELNVVAAERRLVNASPIFV